MFYFTDGSNYNWKDYTLIVPSVSVGNVGQLASDLIISSTELTKIGYIHDDSILPMVGNDPFSKPDQKSCHLVTSCEIYQSSKDKIVIIQQRAPFVKGKRGFFRKKLVEWIKTCGFYQVIILTSSYAHERLDRQLIGCQERFLASPKMELKMGKAVTDEMKWVELEKRLGFPAPSSIQDTGTETQGSIYIPGGGIAKTMFEECCNDIAVLLVLTFCAEGDNVPDAIRLANYLNQYLQIKQESNKDKSSGQGDNSQMWKIPSSWRLTFGSRADPMLFH